MNTIAVTRGSLRGGPWDPWGSPLASQEWPRGLHGSRGRHCAWRITGPLWLGPAQPAPDRGGMGPSLNGGPTAPAPAYREGPWLSVGGLSFGGGGSSGARGRQPTSNSSAGPSSGASCSRMRMGSCLLRSGKPAKKSHYSQGRWR